MYKPSSRPSLRGFNLIEAAIVLGVIGLVIGGIWVAAASVRSSQIKAEAVAGTIQIVDNVNNLFRNQVVASQVNITSAMIAARAIPANFISNNSFVPSWGGTGTIMFGNGNLEIQYSAVPRTSCVDLALRLAEATAELSDSCAPMPLTPIFVSQTCRNNTNPVTLRFVNGNNRASFVIIPTCVGAP